MVGKLIKLALGVSLAILLFATAGCGGSGGSGDESSGAAGGAEASSSGGEAGSEEVRQEPHGLPAKGSKELARQFTNIDGYVAGRFLSNQKEREAASEALESFTEAQDDEDVDAVCDHLSAKMLEYVEQLVDTAPDPPDECGDALSLALESYSGLWEVNSLQEPVGFFLVKGNSGYALFHGKQGWDYMAQMTWEEGEWKVDSFNSMPIGCRVAEDPQCENSAPS